MKDGRQKTKTKKQTNKKTDSQQVEIGHQDLQCKCHLCYLTICGVMFTLEGPSVFGKSCFPTANDCGCTVTKDSTPGRVVFTEDILMQCYIRSSRCL